jgi:hypothetical protein
MAAATLRSWLMRRRQVARATPPASLESTSDFKAHRRVPANLRNRTIFLHFDIDCSDRPAAASSARGTDMLNLSKRPRRTTRDIPCGPVRVDRIYVAIRNEGIPQRFRDLLAQLEAAEAQPAGAGRHAKPTGAEPTGKVVPHRRVSTSPADN